MELSLSFQILLLLPHLIVALGSRDPESTSMAASDQLSLDYYARTCLNFEAIVDRKIKYWVFRDYTLAASLIRLHFHDCAVRIGGPFWENKYGRKQGRTSLAKEVDLVPAGHENVTYLIEFFQSRGLSLLDLVVLSGSHTIGRCTCDAIQQRLYNFNGTGKPDPSIDAQYLNFLRRKCQWATEVVELDATTPTTFDSMYYKNLEKKMGLLLTDQLLYSDSRTSPIVKALATQPMLFYQQFALSMVNLANGQVLAGNEGEIRTNCNFVNP